MAVVQSHSTRVLAPTDWKQSVKTKGSGLPSRVVLHGVEGIGKTSFAANAPKPFFLMAKGETGLETLIDSGRLGDIPHFPEINSFSDMLSAIEWLTTEEHDYKTAVIDTLNGTERLCHQHVCDRDYKGDWSGKGFASYMQGYDVSIGDWTLLLAALDKLRETRRMAIICLCHTDVKTFKNPTGADYDRYRPALHDKTWNVTHRWADHVLFANFYTEVVTEGMKATKGKAHGGNARVIYTTRTAAWDAKNRGGFPDEIEMGATGAEAFANFMQAVKDGRAVN